MKIAVIGTGYVGLVVGTCFAETGNDVICVDVDRKKIAMLRKGKTPIFEPGLAEMLKKNLAEKRISFTADLKLAVTRSDVIFLGLPTPPAEDGSADLRHILEASEQVAGSMNAYKVIVTKSTVPVGTADRIRTVIAKRTKFDFDVVSNPEFLKEGAAVNDFMKPDRIVVGSRSPRAIKVMEELYSPFVRTGNPIFIMDEKSSEVTKYAANAFLATKVSFMNEIANLCEEVGADVDMVRRGIGSDERIGTQFLFPGVGYGGSCFPKDVRALSKTAEEHAYHFRILHSVHEVNREQRLRFSRKIVGHFRSRMKGKVVAVWGLAFKPNTDDMREAPAVTIVEELVKAGATVRVHDPAAMAEARKRFGKRVRYFENNYDAVRGADALVVVTEWNEFRRPDLDRMKKLMRGHVIFDGRNIYNPAVLKEKGFLYFGVGRS
jgi:UDPglucose 6-dehydrogenase